MDTDQVLKTIDKMKSVGIQCVEVTGGEIFLRNDIEIILNHFDTVGLPFKINTNGTILKEQHFVLLENLKMLQCFGTSIDGDPDTHDLARGHKGSFQKTAAALERLKNLKCDRMICFTVTRKNIHCIDFVCSLAKKLNVSRLLFMMEMSCHECGIYETANMFSVEPDKIFVNEKQQQQAIIDSVCKIKKARKKYGVLAPIYPHLAGQRPEEFESKKYSKSLFCKAMSNLNISSNGELRVCQFIGKSFGNFLEEIDLNGMPMRGARKSILLNRTMLPICESCPCVEEIK